MIGLLNIIKPELILILDIFHLTVSTIFVTYTVYTQTYGCKEAVTMFIAQIDKKAASRSRDNLVPFTDVLASLKPSEFTDFQLARYKVLTSQQTCLLSLWQK